MDSYGKANRKGKENGLLFMVATDTPADGVNTRGLLGMAIDGFESSYVTLGPLAPLPQLDWRRTMFYCL